MKRRIITAACAAAMLFSGCSVDVNSLVSSKPEDSSSKQSAPASDTDSHTDVFYEHETDTDTDTQTDTQTDSDPAAFDESKYLTMFASGAAEIPLTADALYGSEEVGEVKSGDRVSVVRRDVQGYTFVYSPTLERFGYVASQYLADYSEEATIGEVWYVRPAQAKLYSDTEQTVELEDVVMNDMVTVLVKRTDGKWRVADKQGNIGYIDKGLLSEKKVKPEVASKKNESSSKSESKHESKRESKQESKSEKAASSRTVSASPVGKGAPPERYTEYIVDVDVGYLALRDIPSADESELLGKLYYEDTLYVIDTSGSFWYVYSPSLGMYGYVTGSSDYLYPAGDSRSGGEQD